MVSQSGTKTALLVANLTWASKIWPCVHAKSGRFLSILDWLVLQKFFHFFYKLILANKKLTLIIKILFYEKMAKINQSQKFTGSPEYEFYWIEIRHAGTFRTTRTIPGGFWGYHGCKGTHVKAKYLISILSGKNYRFSG